MTAPATFHMTCKRFPTQVEGVTADGRPYYFRARHGRWELHLGELGWPDEWSPETGYANENDWIEDETIIAEGDDPTHGEMPDEDVLAILREHLP